MIIDGCIDTERYSLFVCLFVVKYIYFSCIFLFIFLIYFHNYLLYHAIFFSLSLSITHFSCILDLNSLNKLWFLFELTIRSAFPPNWVVYYVSVSVCIYLFKNFMQITSRCFLLKSNNFIIFCRCYRHHDHCLLILDCTQVFIYNKPNTQTHSHIEISFLFFLIYSISY